MGVSFSDFICHIYEQTNRLYLPTQITDNIFGQPESVFIVFREYPFAKYQISFTLDELQQEMMPRSKLVSLAQEFRILDV